MLDNIDDKKLDSNSIEPPARQIDTHHSIDLKLAHELAHCLRDHDTEKFIFIYDFKIPDTFDPSRIDRLKENSRILSELHPTEFAKVCDDLKCHMDHNRIVKNQEYFRQKSAADSSSGTINYENEALAKQFLNDSDGPNDAFNLPQLSGPSSSMCRDGFVTNLRYQTYKDNKRNETQLTSCYDEVYAVKNNESDELDSDEKLCSSASSSISYRSTKNDHVIINMSDDDHHHHHDLSSFENKYKQQDDYLEALKNECKMGNGAENGREDAARSRVAYQLMAQSQMDRSKLNRSDQMRGDFRKACDEESDSPPNLDSSQFLLSHVLSKLTEKNKSDKASTLQFNNYKFEEKCEGKNGSDGCRMTCRSDNLDSHGSSMTNSSKHEDDDEEKDDEYEMDFDQYFPHKAEKKNDKGLKKTIEELSSRHVAESKKSLSRNESTESSKAYAVKNAPASAGFHQKYQNCAYFLNCPNPELQQQNKTTEEKSAPIDNKTKSAPNAKKSQKKASNNQNDSKKNSMYSKHWIEDVDSLLEFITSTSIKSEQKPSKSKKQNTETSNPSNNNNNNNNNNNKNLGKKNKKSESECKQKAISTENSELTEPTQLDAESIESPPSKINDSNILPHIEQPNIDIHQDLPETEFVTVIKGKKVKKEAKDSKEQFENTRSENVVPSQSGSKKIKQNKSLEKQNSTPRRDSVEKKPPVKTIETKIDPQTTSINQEAKEEKSTEILEQTQTFETKPSSPVFQNSHTNHKESTMLKKSASISSKKTPVVFLDEILMKKSSSFSLPLDIKFGLSTDEEHTVQAEELIDPKTNNSDTDQTILVKKKTKQKRNKLTRTASKRLDLIQNHHSSDSSLNPLTSCDETETSKNKALKKKKSLRKKQADTAPQSTVNSQEAEQSSSGPSFQGYYTQPFANQYQPYIIYQIDPNTNLPVALIPVNAYNIAPQVNTDATSPLGSQYYTAMDLNAYNYQLANYQYMQQFGQNYQANMVPMAYSVFVPPSGPTESQSQANVQPESQAQRPAENASDDSRTNSRDFYQNGAIGQSNYNLPMNYMHNHYLGHYASYPSFSNLNNGYMHRSCSLSNKQSGSASEINPSQSVQNENSSLLNKNVAGSNAKFKNPRHPNNAF